jgi:DNA-binding response OmpR family regulator
MNNMKAKILLVEDDVNLGFVVADKLRSLNYDVTLAMDGAEGFKRYSEGEFHICILDVMMPKKDGFSLAKDIRKVNKEIPILFLSAKSDTEDKIQGFEAGCDDYLTKPFSTEELILRVKALLKRVDLSFDETKGGSQFQIGNYHFDFENYVLLFGDETRKLTKKEAEILQMFCKHRNQVLPRELVLNAVWGQDDYFVGRSLDVFVTKLRKYLSEDERVVISNIHGVGFKFEAPE